jgi:hypothetical protein
MDVCIIKCFKGLYRLNLASKIIANIECGLSALATEVKFVDAMQMLASAWQNLDSKIIVNCFKKCGFYRTFDNSNDNNLECLEKETQFGEIHKNFNSICKNRIEANFEEYVNFDNNLDALILVF